MEILAALSALACTLMTFVLAARAGSWTVEVPVRLGASAYREATVLRAVRTWPPARVAANGVVLLGLGFAVPAVAVCHLELPALAPAQTPAALGAVCALALGSAIVAGRVRARPAPVVIAAIGAVFSIEMLLAREIDTIAFAMAPVFACGLLQVLLLCRAGVRAVWLIGSGGLGLVFGFAVGPGKLLPHASDAGPNATDRLSSDVDAVVVLATKIAVALDADRYVGPLPTLPEPDLVRDIARSSPEEAEEAVGFLASIRAANLLVARANACPGCVDPAERLRRRLRGHGSQPGLVDRGRVLSAMLRARHPRR